uniref:ATP synthase F0 subunit 8 n=1 Tax=Pseudocleopatra dartevellei TaxID=2650574 RepID=A0A5J6E382_9CAEN|nr:ATP synthase F0 subunit 8 [Pseudocleopatra dartevellei]QEU52729.1 ATP synthase F0 subunit 8 [Pseudocleopatra dartevellei]
MPQLSPLNWIFLFLLFWLIIFLIFCLIWWHGSTAFKVLGSSEKSYLKLRENKWGW